MRYPKLQDLSLQGRRVFLRVDFNVPLKKTGEAYTVADSTRIEGALPTIQYLRERGARVILASHLGRPKGKREDKYSLEPVGHALSELLSKEVILTEDLYGDGPKGLIQQMAPGDVLMLENLRFDPGEEANSSELATRWAALCDTYVTDAFGALHRAHASTAALPQLVQEKAIGFLIQRELQFLEPLRSQPKKPFGLLMGGAKVSDKMAILEALLPKTDVICIGGAMAYTFLKAQGQPVGKSLVEDPQFAERILKAADARRIRIYLPEDHVAVTAFEAERGTTVTALSDSEMGLDIGPKTVASFLQAFQGMETLFWNGPMGVFEREAFASGTLGLAKGLASLHALKLVGGGDSASAIKQAGCESGFDFISTGGGATLEFLEGIELPGLKVLALSHRHG